jgi:hypothetical protein
VIYGRSGTGKTTFAGTFPLPILYLDVMDRGTDSIADIDDIFVREIRSFEDFEDTYWYLNTSSDIPYSTIVIDTVSQVQSLLVAERMKKKGQTNRIATWGSLTRREWGDIAAQMKEALQNYCDLTEAGDAGLEVVFIAQDRVFNASDEEEQNTEMLAPEIGPSLSPSIARSLNAGVDVIANTYIRERRVKEEKRTKRVIEYCLGVGPSPLYTRKIRKPRSLILPDVVVDPTYEDIIGIIKGE